MKLKTLKDLKFRDWNSCTDEQLEDYIRSVIKKEAIKWVKFFMKNKDSQGFKLNIAYDFKITDIEGVINWIKYSHNITEEDLK